MRFVFFRLVGWKNQNKHRNPGKEQFVQCFRCDVDYRSAAIQVQVAAGLDKSRPVYKDDQPGPHRRVPGEGAEKRRERIRNPRLRGLDWRLQEVIFTLDVS